MPGPARAIDHAELDARFKTHPGSDPKKGATHEFVRDEIAATARKVIEEIPPGREASLTVTALEEALHWADAAIESS